MAQQETYSNWLGPPAAPTKRLVRQGGIYSIAGAMTPVGDFRPASPDSFEEDYDDVSMAELSGGLKEPKADEDLQSQKSKGGTGLYTLAGKHNLQILPQRVSSSLSLDSASHQTSKLWDFSPISPPAEPRGGRGQSHRTSLAILYLLVALSFVAWALLFALAVVKYREILVELELLRSNRSEDETLALFCRSISDTRKCSAGWENFGESCYSFSTETTSWGEANQTCADQGAHLIIIDSEQEQDFLKENINSTYWLGVTDQQKEGSWVWTNGQEVTLSYFNVWKENKDRDQKNCGSIGPDGIWSDAKCSHPNLWICEKSWNC
ncbi:LOW QUALITY PROTEIN: hepatic lectin-like [Heliangelus exortis]|uniref:LOW QUALITY PROTEIN: hepatic lectin-like n=1 Tax=Heliangelus exortis TaxID=472823 RepID=UPI003A8F823D